MNLRPIVLALRDKVKPEGPNTNARIDRLVEYFTWKISTSFITRANIL